ARITGRDANATPVVEAFEKAGSASLAPLAASDGFVILPLGSGNIKAGDIVQFIPH
ncbi:MAG TPA: molybdopterin molybdenumtransferase MoeA, partial [Rhizobiales bacterium]|nr:molybdopterin molybdenumtransferase MoeA [Hyphomicrobiales bacterium]